MTAIFGGIPLKRQRKAVLTDRKPPPDIVIRVVTPTQVALERNRQRYEPGKDKSDSYLLFNHKNVVLPSFLSARTVEVSTDQSQEETIRAVRRLLWELL